MTALNVVLSVNERFASPCAVVIASACETSASPAALRFHVYSSDLSAASRQMMTWLAAQQGSNVEFHRADPSRVAAVPAMRNVSVDSHVRLLVPEGFQKEDRILYLDADVLVLKDLLALRDVDMGDAIAAVAPNGPAPFIEEFNRVHARPVGMPVFNAGVMLIQPSLWVTAKVAERAVNWLIANEKKLIFRNQDALNILLEDRLVWLDPVWNVESRLYREWLLGFSRRSPLVEKASIVHYTGGDKPWIPGRHTFQQALYNRYLEQAREATRRTGGDIRALPRKWTAYDHAAAVINTLTVGARVRMAAMKNAVTGIR